MIQTPNAWLGTLVPLGGWPMNLQIFTLYITYSHISTISRNPVPTSPKSAASSLIMFYRLQQLKAIRIQVLQRLSRWDMGHEPPEVLGTQEAEPLAEAGSIWQSWYVTSSFSLENSAQSCFTLPEYLGDRHRSCGSWFHHVSPSPNRTWALRCFDKGCSCWSILVGLAMFSP